MSTNPEIQLLAARMLRVFSTNSNPNGHYTADFKNATIEKGGKRVPAYKPVTGRLTQKEFEDHLEGKLGLLFVPVTQAGACRIGKIDTDDYSGDPVERAKKYAKAIARWNLPMVAELTKSGGVHLAHYSPFTESADDMRAKMADWAATLHIKPGTEIFPKQSKLMDGEIGSGLNVPYFLGSSLEDCRNCMVDKEGKRQSVAAWLDVIENMPAAAGHHPGTIDVEAAADLLSKHWTDGNRDNLNLAVLGTLLRAGVEVSQAQEIQDACMGVAQDGGKHVDAAGVERMLENGKKVPGYTKLKEYIGEEDATELMRLAGGKPPPDPVSFEIRPMPAQWRTAEAPPLAFAIAPLFPRKTISVISAEGGTGKTGFGLTAAVCVATGRPFFELDVTQGKAVYIALEENEDGLHRRVRQIVAAEVKRMRDEKLSAERIEQFHADLEANFFPIWAAGIELHIINAVRGEVSVNSVLIDRLIEKMPRDPTLVFLDPLARLHGTEENANSVVTALINAGERIAQVTGAAGVFQHHVGKDASRNRDKTMNAARGGSGLIAAARSSIRLIQVDPKDAKDFGNVPSGVIEAGDLIECVHNKLNDGKRSATFYLRRQELAFERFHPQTDSPVASHDKLLKALWEWAARYPEGLFKKQAVHSAPARKEIFHPHDIRDREAALDLIDRAMDAGDIVEGPKIRQSKEHWLKFRADFDSPM